MAESGNLIIGAAYENNTSNHQFKGKLDDVRIYSGALSADQIKVLYQKESEGSDLSSIIIPAGSTTSVKYVFAEVVTKTEVSQTNEEVNEDKENNPFEAKLKILEDEKKIIEETNVKFIEENENLKNEINDLSNKIINLNSKISSQEQEINQFDIDKEEMEFLKLNLDHGHKCRKSFFNNKGFLVGSEDYRSCVLNKGRPN